MLGKNMVIKSQELRSGREIVIGLEYSKLLKTNSFTIYLGIYNGTDYLGSLLAQIQAQTQKNFPLVLVDNSSSDESWNRILAWPKEVLERTKLIRNPLNLGGTWIKLRPSGLSLFIKTIPMGQIMSQSLARQ
jgi:hypothetical protein